MQKNAPSLSLLLCSLLILASCGRDFLESPEFSPPQLNPGSKGEQLNPGLNPGSKGEQLNPISKGEYLVSGQINLPTEVSATARDFTFFIDNRYLPTEWLELRPLGQNTFAYQIRNLEPQDTYILDVRYADQQISTMIPASAKALNTLNINVRSSLTVALVRFADRENLRTLDNWTVPQLEQLTQQPELSTLLEATNAQLQTQNNLQQAVQSAIENQRTLAIQALEAIR